MTREELAVFLREMVPNQTYYSSKLPSGLLDGWSFTSDGYVLIAVEGDLGFGDYSGDAKGARDMCVALIADAPTGAEVDADALRKFARHQFQDRSSCEDCAGKGLIECGDCDAGQLSCVCPTCDDEHESACGECDGRATERCESCGPMPERPSREAWLGDFPLNLNLLANVLRCAPDGPLQVKRSGTERLTLYGLGFRAVIMGLREGIKGTPRYEMEVPA